MAKLPIRKIKKRIVDMIAGETGFTVPWAMWIDGDNECFLNEAFSIEASSGGTVQLKITRVKNGYIAFIHDVDYEWSPKLDHGFVNTDENLCYGKVVGFKLNEADKPKQSVEKLIQQAIAEENYELAAELKKQKT